MQPRVFNLRYNINLIKPIVFVLEPSENDWQLIFNRSRSLIESLPGRVNEIYILGSREAYSISIPMEFGEKASGWYRKNKGRANLIRPVFEMLSNKGFQGIVAIFCSNLPHDIDDWADSEIIKRSTFIKKEASSSSSYEEIELTLENTQIINSLRNPVENLEVKGSGFAPLNFQLSSTGEAKIIWKEGDFKLVISPNGERLDLHLKAISYNPPKLYIKRKKGSETIDGQTEHEWFKEPEWKEINEELRPVIMKCISREDFKCPRCGKMHNFNVLICPEDDIILKDMPSNTCIIFKEGSFLSLSDFYAYPVGEKIITRKGKIYKLRNEKWEYVKEVKPYEEVEDRVYALFNRI